jgi:nicotinamidase-related amidase
LLMRDQWNAGLYGPLVGVYEEGRELEGGREDVWIHKNRMSALWADKTTLGEFLEQQGIRSLLFSGVNTDQCVGGTLQDAFSKGYDCVLLEDAAGTSSPGFAQEGIEYNARKSWGFATSCGEFAKGVEEMVKEDGK